jgi:hypothetical protein
MMSIFYQQNLYIKIENGQPIDHPVVEENLIEVFGSIPDNYQPFQKTVCNLPTDVYETHAREYQCIDGIWQETWTVVPMPEEEKQDKINSSRSQGCGYASWIFNEDTCRYEAPVPYPTDGKIYKWDEQTFSWNTGS